MNLKCQRNRGQGVTPLFECFCLEWDVSCERSVMPWINNVMPWINNVMPWISGIKLGGLPPDDDQGSAGSSRSLTA